MASKLLPAESIPAPTTSEQLTFDLEANPVYTPRNPRDWDQGVQTELPAVIAPTEGTDRSAIEQQYREELEDDKRDLAALALPEDPLSGYYRDDYSKPYEPAPPITNHTARSVRPAASTPTRRTKTTSVEKPADHFDSDVSLKKVLNLLSAARQAEGRAKLSENNPVVGRLARERGITRRDVIEDAETTAIDRSNEARAEYERLTNVAQAIASIVPHAARITAPSIDEFTRTNFGTPQAKRRNQALRIRIDRRNQR